MDKASIQCRTLNESKGDAVRSTRFQIDKLVYPQVVTSLIKESKNINIIYDEMIDVKIQETGGFEIVTDQSSYSAKKLIVTTGTFFGGVLHSGEAKKNGGRVNWCLHSNFKTIYTPKDRSFKFKTGTPPRLRESVDFLLWRFSPAIRAHLIACTIPLIAGNLKWIVTKQELLKKQFPQCLKIKKRAQCLMVK